MPSFSTTVIKLAGSVEMVTPPSDEVSTVYITLGYFLLSPLLQVAGTDTPVAVWEMLPVRAVNSARVDSVRR